MELATLTSSYMNKNKSYKGCKRYCTAVTLLTVMSSPVELVEPSYTEDTFFFIVWHVTV